jgi:hypothetical protein
VGRMRATVAAALYNKHTVQARCSCDSRDANGAATEWA